MDWSNEVGSNLKNLGSGQERLLHVGNIDEIVSWHYWVMIQYHMVEYNDNIEQMSHQLISIIYVKSLVLNHQERDDHSVTQW